MMIALLLALAAVLLVFFAVGIALLFGNERLAYRMIVLSALCLALALAIVIVHTFEIAWKELS